MIEIKNAVKYFEGNCAVNHVSLEIPEGILFGLLGTNGAGKSTLLRMMAGILKADDGEILFDGKPGYENPECKAEVCYLPDSPYYFPGASLREMAGFYKAQYPGLEPESVRYMADTLNLDMDLPLRTFSKGMKRQAFLILALCTGTKYLICDEVFDGLDPVAAEAMKRLFRREMEERRFTVVVASHKLQDLEDICDSIAILHKGGLVRAGDMRKKAENIWKLQCVFQEEGALEKLKERLEVLRGHRDGYFVTLLVRGPLEEIKAEIQKHGPVFSGEAPMTLEEVFLAEMEETGYDIRKVLQ